MDKKICINCKQEFEPKKDNHDKCDICYWKSVESLLCATPNCKKFKSTYDSNHKYCNDCYFGKKN